MTLFERLERKVLTLSTSVWENRVSGPGLAEWLQNFSPDGPPGTPSERLHALYMLGQFIYFGQKEMRVLLKALFRDVFRYPIVEAIRRRNGDTLDPVLINSEFQKELVATRFLGVGNPSESGVHLLYYFRQENELPKKAFIATHEIFARTQQMKVTLENPNVRRYVFIDDFCGSGTQARDYSMRIVEDIKSLDPSCTVDYYALFGLAEGMEFVRANTKFDRSVALVELGHNYRCFSRDARCFVSSPPEIDRIFAESVCRKHGAALEPLTPVGFGDCQLLIGFFHNTPDNTLPIIWKDSLSPPWVAVFRRYDKKYQWGQK